MDVHSVGLLKSTNSIPVIVTRREVPVENATSGGRRVSTPLRCKVSGCTSNLTTAPRTHQRFRLCNEHIKAPVISVDGVASRFCQQCSKFHPLDQFHGTNRTCRMMLIKNRARQRNAASAGGCGQGSSGSSGGRPSSARGEGDEPEDQEADELLSLPQPFLFQPASQLTQPLPGSRKSSHPQLPQQHQQLHLSDPFARRSLQQDHTNQQQLTETSSLRAPDLLLLDSSGMGGAGVRHAARGMGGGGAGVGHPLQTSSTSGAADVTLRTCVSSPALAGASAGTPYFPAASAAAAIPSITTQLAGPLGGLDRMGGGCDGGGSVVGAAVDGGSVLWNGTELGALGFGVFSMQAGPDCTAPASAAAAAATACNAPSVAAANPAAVVSPFAAYTVESAAIETAANRAAPSGTLPTVGGSGGGIAGCGTATAAESESESVYDGYFASNASGVRNRLLGRVGGCGGGGLFARASAPADLTHHSPSVPLSPSSRTHPPPLQQQQVPLHQQQQQLQPLGNPQHEETGTVLALQFEQEQDRLRGLSEPQLALKAASDSLQSHGRPATPASPAALAAGRFGLSGRSSSSGGAGAAVSVAAGMMSRLGSGQGRFSRMSAPPLDASVLMLGGHGGAGGGGGGDLYGSSSSMLLSTAAAAAAAVAAAACTAGPTTAEAASAAVALGSFERVSSGTSKRRRSLGTDTRLDGAANVRHCNSGGGNGEGGGGAAAEEPVGNGARCIALGGLDGMAQRQQRFASAGSFSGHLSSLQVRPASAACSPGNVASLVLPSAAPAAVAAVAEVADSGAGSRPLTPRHAAALALGSLDLGKERPAAVTFSASAGCGGGGGSADPCNGILAAAAVAGVGLAAAAAVTENESLAALAAQWQLEAADGTDCGGAVVDSAAATFSVDSGEGLAMWDETLTAAAPTADSSLSPSLPLPLPVLQEALSPPSAQLLLSLRATGPPAVGGGVAGGGGGLGLEGVQLQQQRMMSGAKIGIGGGGGGIGGSGCGGALGHASAAVVSSVDGWLRCAQSEPAWGMRPSTQHQSGYQSPFSFSQQAFDQLLEQQQPSATASLGSLFEGAPTHGSHDQPNVNGDCYGHRSCGHGKDTVEGKGKTGSAAAVNGAAAGEGCVERTKAVGDETEEQLMLLMCDLFGGNVEGDGGDEGEDDRRRKGNEAERLQPPSLPPQPQFPRLSPPPPPSLQPPQLLLSPLLQPPQLALPCPMSPQLPFFPESSTPALLEGHVLGEQQGQQGHVAATQQPRPQQLQHCLQQQQQPHSFSRSSLPRFDRPPLGVHHGRFSYDTNHHDHHHHQSQLLLQQQPHHHHHQPYQQQHQQKSQTADADCMQLALHEDEQWGQLWHQQQQQEPKLHHTQQLLPQNDPRQQQQPLQQLHPKGEVLPLHTEGASGGSRGGGGSSSMLQLALQEQQQLWDKLRAVQEQQAALQQQLSQQQHLTSSLLSLQQKQKE